MALVTYHALDYMHSEDEERLISPDLEGLITEMTSCDAAGEISLHLNCLPVILELKLPLNITSHHITIIHFIIKAGNRVLRH